MDFGPAHSWALFTLRSGAEIKLEEKLVSCQVKCYVPKIVVRRRIPHARNIVIMSVAAFPGYAFIFRASAISSRMAERFRLRQLLLGPENAKREVVVPQKEIDRIREQENSWPEIDTGVKPKLNIGDSVECSAFAFIGLRGKVIDVTVSLVTVEFHEAHFKFRPFLLSRIRG